MASFKNVNTDYTLTCNQGNGLFTINAETLFNGNVTYTYPAITTTAFITVAANNTSGTTDVTFTSAPPTNSNNIVINFRATQIVSYNQVTTSQIVPTGVSAGTYGGTTAIPVIVVNSQGQVTSASNSSINLNAISGDLSVTGNITATKAVTSNNGVYTSNNFSGTFTDGVVMDYVTGNGRVSVGTADGINFYNGGVAGTLLGYVSAGGDWDLNGTLTVGTGSPISLTNPIFQAVTSFNNCMPSLLNTPLVLIAKLLTPCA